MQTKLPEHLFLSSSGSLHDTRRADWANRPLREHYADHSADIKTGLQLRACLRAGPYAWPGGYPLYFLTASGDTISFEGVHEHFFEEARSIRDKSSDRIVACGINWEDPEMTCVRTGKLINSAYGD
jgi:hypothetical protein